MSSDDSSILIDDVIPSSTSKSEGTLVLIDEVIPCSNSEGESVLIEDVSPRLWLVLKNKPALRGMLYAIVPICENNISITTAMNIFLSIVITP